MKILKDHPPYRVGDVVRMHWLEAMRAQFAGWAREWKVGTNPVNQRETR